MTSLGEYPSNLINFSFIELSKAAKNVANKSKGTPIVFPAVNHTSELPARKQNTEMLVSITKKTSVHLFLFYFIYFIFIFILFSNFLSLFFFLL